VDESAPSDGLGIDVTASSTGRPRCRADGALAGPRFARCHPLSSRAALSTTIHGVHSMMTVMTE
jgi:hypothetical protein